MTDSITVLSHSHNFLAKTWKADGTITPYDKGKNFSVQQHEVQGIRELSALLAALEHNPHACIIRGRLNPQVTDTLVMRRLDVFDDQPLHTILIEVDDFEPLSADPVLEPVGAAEEYIKTVLPSAFHGIAYHWQLSNSAGHPDKRHLLKAHLWFWLETPASSAQLKAWSLATGVKCDRSVFNPVQVHYTSAPVFEAGVADPVPERSGFVGGLVGDRVILDLADVPLAPVLRKDRSIVTGRSDDSTAQHLYDHDMVLGVGPGGQLYIECPHGDHEPGAISSTAYFPAGTGGIERGHFKCLHSTCTGRTDVDFEDALGIRLAEMEDLPALIDEHGKPIPDMPKLNRNKSGQIEATLPNLVAALACPYHFGWQVRYDTLFCKKMITPYGGEKWRPLTDVDAVAIRESYEKERNFKCISERLMQDAIALAADKHHFDTAQYWLNSLPEWDGVPRVEQFFVRYFGVEDSAYTRAVGRYIWTALAGRVMQPGIKADMVPVLVGSQGVGKSTGVRAIVPDNELFAEIDLSDRGADLARLMRGKLIGEIGELRGMRRAEKEAVKAFLSRTVDEWVEKYDRYRTKMPRRIVLIGTTNQEEFLEDATGNRRWLPMTVGAVDVSGIETARNQLWAEGLSIFTANGIDWSAETLATDMHQKHMVKDSWADAIEGWLSTPDEPDGLTPEHDAIKLSDVLRFALGFDIKQIKRSDEMRVASILRAMGYAKKRLSTDGARHSVWVREASKVSGPNVSTDDTPVIPSEEPLVREDI